jgi:hypothetical protein
MINGLNISDSSKSKMIDIIRDFTGTDGSGASSVRPPVTGTPYEEGNLARNYDALVAEFQRMQAELNRSIAEGGSEESVGTTKKGDKSGAACGLSGDFFTALARAIGSTLQAQANEVQELSGKLERTVNANIAAKEANLVGRGDAGLTETDAVKAKNADDGIMVQQTMLSAESMKLNFLATGLQTALKAVGDSLSTMGRS